MHTSSIAITTSTVSRLSRPRSLAKCAFGVICQKRKDVVLDHEEQRGHCLAAAEGLLTLAGSLTWETVSTCFSTRGKGNRPLEDQEKTSNSGWRSHRALPRSSDSLNPSQMTK
jgi:hypothetical protein